MQASRNTKHPLERARSIRSQRLHSWPDYEGPAFPRTELGAIPVVLYEGPFGVDFAIRGESCGCGWPLSARLSPLAPIPAEGRFPPTETLRRPSLKVSFGARLCENARSGCSHATIESKARL